MDSDVNSKSLPEIDTKALECRSVEVDAIREGPACLKEVGTSETNVKLGVGPVTVIHTVPLPNLYFKVTLVFQSRNLSRLLHRLWCRHKD